MMLFTLLLNWVEGKYWQTRILALQIFLRGKAALETGVILVELRFVFIYSLDLSTVSNKILNE